MPPSSTREGLGEGSAQTLPALPPLTPPARGRGIPPTVFVEKQRGAMRIMAVDAIALEQGIAPGLMLANARALAPDLVVVDHDPAADHALLIALADDCDRFTPMVALDPPQGLILDLTGCCHLRGGQDALVTAIRARFSNVTLCLACAETPDKARAQARYGTVLPVAALDLDDDHHTALKRAGLGLIDDLAARPRAPLAARFGRGMTGKLARVLGEEDHRITPRRVPPALFVMHRFAEPIATSAAAIAIITDMAKEAEIALRERGQGGRCFIISLYRSDGDTRRLSLETGAPTRDPALLIRLLAERIDTLSDPLDPGFGYDAIRLDVPVAEPLGPAQIGMAGEVAAEVQLGGLVDRLSTRLGANRVQRLAGGNSHIPELAGFAVAARAPVLPFPWEQSEPGEPPARPLHLFDPPQRIEVIAEVPDGPPRRFRWRRETRDVVLYEGPERIAAEWWKRRDLKGLTRDYFRIEDQDGRRYWLFRHGLYGSEKPHPDWYLHGLFV